MDANDRKIDDPRVSGGGEMFCKLINEVIPDDETSVMMYFVNVVDIPNKNKRTLGFDYAENIINEANKHLKPRIIISNFNETLFTGGRIISSGIPVMVVNHNLYPFPSIIDRFNDLLDFGHSVYLVSQYQYDFYSAMAKRVNKKFKITGFLNPAFAEERKEISKVKYEVGTIGRCDTQKNPFLLKTLLQKTKMSHLVITSKPNESNTEQKYLNDNIRYYNRQNLDDPNTLWDLPHKEVIGNISQCRTYFSTWHAETWGITALEALSCGVPIILNGKNGKHASTDIASSPRHYKVIPHNDEEELIKAVHSFRNVDRKEIQQMTLEKHSKLKWKTQIMDAIHHTIEHYNKNRIDLEDFME